MEKNTAKNLDCEEILLGLQQQLPVQIIESIDITDHNIGLVIIDEVNGFCTAGAGNLAPAQPDAVINAMINRTDELARNFINTKRPIMVFCDTHDPDRPEPPYPPHCNKGTGEEELVSQLKWLGTYKLSGVVTIIKKDCINGYIGGLHGISDLVRDWIEFENLKKILVVGICTDICDLQFVQTMLSARNHDMLGELEDVIVLVPACATYDLPLVVTKEIGLPDTAAHPRGITQHIGLYLMQSSGAILVNNIVLS